MITVICNIYINSDKKLVLFRQTFPLVYKISDNWLVNIRGKHREEVIEYIKQTFSDAKENCTFFSGLYNNNWAKSTREMLDSSKYDHVYVFLEDHFLLKPFNHFKNVVQDMINSKIEYFGYSFFNNELSILSAEGLYPVYSKYFFSFQVNEKNISYLKRSNKSFYPYSLVSICTKKYFQKLLNIEKKILIKIPFFIQTLMENVFFFYPRNRAFWYNMNKIFSHFGIRFVIYPSTTPFNLEKSLFDCNREILPIQVGGLREELFANWDDDNGLNNSSLIKRGLYPGNLRNNGQSRQKPTDGQDHFLSKGRSSNHVYCPDVSRVQKLPMKYIHVKKGALKISSTVESFILNENQSEWIFANIPHTLLACEDCIFCVYIDSGLL